MQRVRLRCPLGVALLVMAFAAPAASAQSEFPDSPGDENSGIDQYVPSAPYAGGERPLGSRRGARGRPLSARARRAFEGHPDAALLGALATSPQFGAPAEGEGLGGAEVGGRGSRGGGDGTAGAGGTAGERIERPGLVSTVADTIFGGESGNLIFLLILVATLGVGTVAALRRRQLGVRGGPTA